MGDSESTCEASGESSRPLGKKDESLAMGSLHSGGTSRQKPESDPSTSTQNLPLREESSVCAIDKEGNTALHHAVALACQKGDSDDSLYQCIDLLMGYKQMNVNMPNKKGYTAIGLAVHHRHKPCIEKMLKHPLAKQLYLDNYPADRESTVREIMEEIYPELQPLLPAPLMESLESSNIDTKLLAALQWVENNIFSETLSPTNPNPWYGEPYHSSLLEIACQMKNSNEIVKILLDNRADPNITNRVTGMPLLHATARSGNFEVLQLLLDKSGIDTSVKDHEQRTVLHWLAGVNEGKPGDKERIEKCFKLLLESNYFRKKGVDDRDTLGNTALYIAVERGFRDRAKMLLSKGADVRVFERGSKILLSDSLSIVKEILDDGLMSYDEPLNSKDLQVKLHYQLFMNIVPRIAESKFHRELLTHPVMSSFLMFIWEKLRLTFILDLIFYMFFLLFLTAYIICSEKYSTLNAGCAASNTTDTFSSNESNITSGINDSNFTTQPNRNIMRFLQIFLMISWCLLIVREVNLYRWVCLKTLEFWLEILLIISTPTIFSGVVEGTGLKCHVYAVALFLGWLEAFLLSSKIPFMSVQNEMLRTVSIRFLMFLMGYVYLLVAFAFSFHILFKGSSEQGGTKMFTDPAVSLLKTIVMFTGEFDTSSLSFHILPYTSHVIFLLFVVLVATVLLNLLNDLAVNDTGEIKKEAERLSLVAKAKLISRIEVLVNALPKCMKTFVELKEDMFVIYPNRQNRHSSDSLRHFWAIIREKEKFHEKEKSTAFPKEWSMFIDEMSALKPGQIELKGKLDLTSEESLKILVQIQRIQTRLDG